eukprot:7857345-Prorocentrum_lima.AAC.1
MQNCEKIACPPIDETCTPGPYQLRPQESCLLHYVEASVGSGSYSRPSLLLSLALLWLAARLIARVP